MTWSITPTKSAVEANVNADSASTDIIVIVITAIGSALIFGGIVAFICHRKVRKLKEEIAQANVVTADTNGKRLKSNSNFERDDLENEGFQPMPNGRRVTDVRINDGDVVAIINSTEIGDDIDNIPNRMNNDEHITNNQMVIGAMIYDPNTDNGEDA